jgi:hypothetical protein
VRTPPVGGQVPTIHIGNHLPPHGASGQPWAGLLECRHAAGSRSLRDLSAVAVRLRSRSTGSVAGIKSNPILNNMAVATRWVLVGLVASTPTGELERLWKTALCVMQFSAIPQPAQRRYYRT